MNPDLAIIIPAFKAKFLAAALQSLSDQTVRQFRVYIGDDNSPEDLESVCNQFTSHLDVSYHRFPTNLGGTELVKHWMRCVDLKADESWIWLFSDDDIAEKHCVEKFYEALEKTSAEYDVYRFNTMVINEKGEMVSAADPSPEHENPMSLACEILHWNRGNSMPDHIFKAARYRELNGFVDFAFAQGSDWASSINYAYPKGLFTIAGPKVHWRSSSLNVSAVDPSKRTPMILGHLQFLSWILKRFTSVDEKTFKVKLDDIKSAAMYNLEVVFRKHYRGIPAKNFVQIVLKTSQVFGISLLESLRICAAINYKVFRPKFSAAVKRVIMPGKA